MTETVTFAPPATAPAGSVHLGLISVVVIFYNEERFLADAIASVYEQTYLDWELLLVDDGSSDGSSEIARSYASRDPARVRYLEHGGHANRGASAARNLGIRQARGAWVAFLDGDDVWLPNRLERTAALAAAHGGADMIYGRTEYWESWQSDPARAPDRVQPHYFRANRLIQPPDLLLRFLLLRAAYPCMGSLLVRRRAFLEVGGFDESFRGVVDDLVFLGKFCLRHPVYVSDECWDRYRQHAQSDTALVAARGGAQDAQRSYLEWLSRYFEEERVEHPRLRPALAAARRRLERPPDHWRSRLERIRTRALHWPLEPSRP